jgi:hypothetical protein
MRTDEYWQDHFSRCDQSGLSKKAYCKKNKISYSLFFYHQKRLSLLPAVEGFAEVKVEHHGAPEIADAERLSLEFPSGHVLNFPVSMLDKVLALIKC